MTEHKSFLRNVFDAMIEGRQRRADYEMARFRPMTTVDTIPTRKH